MILPGLIPDRSSHLRIPEVVPVVQMVGCWYRIIIGKEQVTIGMGQTQRAVKPLDVIGYPPLLFDDPMLLFWNDTLIRTPAIGIERGMLLVALGYLLPQGESTLTTSVADAECDDLPT